jgi:putative PIN family toxin of toxin-antitoxin system
VRVFLDTNVLVAAFATRGLCADILRQILAEHELITSEVVLTELDRALHQKLRLPKSTIVEIVALLRRYHVEPKPKAKLNLSFSDTEDLWVLSSALSAEIDVFVTGDKDLLTIKRRLPFEITSPRGFWEMLRKQRPK